MYRLDDILGQGYHAHVLLYRSFDRGQDVVDALTLDEAKAVSVAPVIHDLLSGDISAQSQAIYNSNAGISMLQTFDDGVVAIGRLLDGMSQMVQTVSTGVYDAHEVAQYQIRFEDSVADLNRVACDTKVDGYALLCSAESPLKVYLGNGYSIELPAADLRFSINHIDLANSIQEAGMYVLQAQSQVFDYHKTLHFQLTTLEHQVMLADTVVAETMGYGMDEPNVDVAQALAQEVVAELLQDSVLALESQSNLSRQRMPSLLGLPLKAPSVLQYKR